MLIVNQDKNIIINFKRINFIKIESNENEFDIEINYADEEWDVIATYDSYERAQEVLQEITQEYKKVARVDEQNNRQPRFYNIPKVYYMPANKEVE